MTKSLKLTRTIPVIADVDVLVVGGGIAGCTAAVTAARNGAKVMLIERFGSLGGNMGPGMFSGAPSLEYPKSMPNGLEGIPGELVRRCEAITNAPLLSHYFRDSQVVSYVWLTMMQEDGVQLLLNTYAADPIMDGDRVVGLVVENKSGAQAIHAKLTIDATGDADVAARAGAPIDDGNGYSHPGMYFAMDNVDIGKFQGEVAAQDAEPGDLEWAEDLFAREFGVARWASGRLRPLIRYFRPAWEMGEYRIVQRIGDLGFVLIDHGIYVGPSNTTNPIPGQRSYGILGAQVGVHGPGLLSGDASIMTQLEIGARMYIFETARFLRRRVPGFEDAYLHVIAPYFHSRGGRSIISEHPITPEEAKQGRRFDDVVFLCYERETGLNMENGFDFPYRQLLPQRIDALLVTGRAAIIQPPVNRSRWKVFLMGQATGAAAALAIRDGVLPRSLEVRKLQRLLYDSYHVPFGDQERLQELGLV